MDIGARDGHFLLESGHHGTLWLDLDSLFLRPAALLPSVRELAARIEPYAPEVIVGPLTGGAFLAQMVATELDVALAYSTPADPTADPTEGGLYTRAYEIPPNLHPHLRGRRTAIIDDVINAGSAVSATLTSLTNVSAPVVVAGALLTLGGTGRARLRDAGVPVEALEARDSTIHPPLSCPLCARGVPLDV